MHLSTALVALTAAIGGVSAHPSPRAGHAHLHNRDGLEFKIAVRPHETTTTTSAEPTTSTTTTPPPPPPTTTKEAPKPTPDTSDDDDSDDDSSSSGGVGFQPFCGGKSKRATYDQIMYAGNTGVEGDWGCNMKIIHKADVKHYKYTAKISSTGEKYTCSCFNKVGPEGLLDGFWFSALDFTVSKPGKDDVYMAFDADTQGGCACGPGDKVERSPNGQLVGTWWEFDCGSEPNDGNSGADVSVLVAGAENMPYYGMCISYEGKVCSSVYSNGENFQAYMPGMEDLDGIGCKGYKEGQTQILLGDNY